MYPEFLSASVSFQRRIKEGQTFGVRVESQGSTCLLPAPGLYVIVAHSFYHMASSDQTQALSSLHKTDSSSSLSTLTYLLLSPEVSWTHRLEVVCSAFRTDPVLTVSGETGVSLR